MPPRAFNVGLNYGLLKFAAPNFETPLSAAYQLPAASQTVPAAFQTVPPAGSPPGTNLVVSGVGQKATDAGAGSGALRRVGRSPLALGALALGGSIGAGFGLGRATAPQPPPRRSAFGW